VKVKGKHFVVQNQMKLGTKLSRKS